MRNRQRIMLGGAMALVTTAAALSLPLQAAGSDAHTKADDRLALLDTTDHQRPNLRFVAERGNMADFTGHGLLELTPEVWINERGAEFSIVLTDGELLMAIHTDGRDLSLARVEGGPASDFLGYMRNHYMPIGGLNPEPVNACADCFEGTGSNKRAMLRCCMTKCEEGSANWCICMSEAQCIGSGGVCEFDLGTCDYTCCAAVVPVID